MNSQGLSDTTPTAARIQFARLLRAGPAARFRTCREMTANMIALSRRALARARPELGPAELSIEWIAIHYGAEIADGMRRRLRSAP